jgi:hypothetical protein
MSVAMIRSASFPTEVKDVLASFVPGHPAADRVDGAEAVPGEPDGGDPGE